MEICDNDKSQGQQILPPNKSAESNVIQPGTNTIYYSDILQ